MKIRKLFLKLDIFRISLITIVLVLFVFNYKTGTWLLGWDNHPIEIDPILYLKRTLTSVWQAWGGQGMVGGMSYASEFPRALVWLPLSFLLPDNFIRYFYTFFCLLFGALGIYQLTKDILFAKFSNKQAKIAAFSSSLFYIFNLGTLQIFYTPMEMFITAYAFIPWLFWIIFITIKIPKLSNYIKLGLLSFLAAPMSITPTVFINYALIVAIILCVELIRSIKAKESISKFFSIGFTLIITNLFWVAPAAYGLLTKPDVVVESKISTLATSDIRDLGQKHANWKDYTVLKSYWFEQSDMVDVKGSDNQWGMMMNQWNEHFEETRLLSLGYFFYFLILLGVVILISNKKYNYRYFVIASFFLGSFALLGSSPPLGRLFNFFQDNSVFLNEIFRLPFSKFIFITLISFSALFGITINYIADKISVLFQNNSEDKNLLHFIILVTLVFPFILYMYPAFKGHFVFDELKVEIPNDYFRVFEHFKHEDPNDRILFFPVNTWAGWQYHDWGYRGSGFIWYGIEQPIVDRAFDVWSKENEAVYLEIHNAIYQNNIDKITKVLDKYQIKSIFVDKSVIAINQDKEPLNISNLQQLLDNSVLFEKVFETEKVDIYKYKSNNNNLFSLLKNPTQTVDLPKWTYEDGLFNNEGNYISSNSVNAIYPFNYLEERNKEIITEIGNEEIVLKFSKPLKLNGELAIPSLNEFDRFNIQIKSQLVSADKIEISFIANPFDVSFDDERFELSQVLGSILVDKEGSSQIFIDNQILNVSSIGQNPTRSKDFYVDNSDDKIDILAGNSIYEFKYNRRINFPKLKTSGAKFIKIIIPKDISRNLNYDFRESSTITALEEFECKIYSEVGYSNPIFNNIDYSWILETKSSDLCLNLPLHDLSHREEFLIKLEGRHLSGRNLRLNIDVLPSRRYQKVIDLEFDNNESEKIYINKSGESKSGYDLNLRNSSITDEITKNEIWSIEVNYLPISVLQKISIKINSNLPQELPLTSHKINDATYITQVAYDIDESYILLNQSYEAGWKLYKFSNTPTLLNKLLPFIGGTEQAEHFKANNWANAWKIEDNGYYIAWYWPQVIEIFAIIILAFTSIIILIKLVYEHRKFV